MSMLSRLFSCGSHLDRLPRRLASLLTLGAVAVGCGEDAESPTGPDSGPELAATATTALTVSQVSTGGYHSCGLAPDNRAYCWGLNDRGQLGDGTTISRSRPVAVARGLRFIGISASDYHTCGVTSDSLAYCWGLNEEGQLGDGTRSQRVKPAAVKGGRHFSLVNTGSSHSCAVTASNRVYCWGDNRWGQVGDGTTTKRLTPVAVAGGLRFRRVVAGGSHTCGVTTGDRGYCWGNGDGGIIGDGSSSGVRLLPVAVAGGLRFRQVTAGGAHTCGLTTNNRAYCWGYNSEGRLGDGTTTNRSTPVAVAGGLSFSQVVAGGPSTCGVTTGNRAYCWGNNFVGGLGDGTFADRSTPVAVVGGLFFSGVSPGNGYHVCGVTSISQVYCWGHNAYGQIGIGTNTGPETCPFVLPCSTKPKQVVGAS